MTTLDYDFEQLQEITQLEAEYGFPGFIVAGVDPEIAAKLTSGQRKYALDWLYIARQRFDEELEGQLGRQPTVEELASRLELSIASW